MEKTKNPGIVIQPLAAIYPKRGPVFVKLCIRGLLP